MTFISTIIIYILKELETLPELINFFDITIVHFDNEIFRFIGQFNEEQFQITVH